MTGASSGCLRARPVPQPHQAVLQHRKLIELVAAIVEQSFDEFRLDGPARFFDRFADRLLELAARKIRHEVLSRAHRLRQAMKIGAIADEVRAHGDEHAHVLDTAAVGVEQDLHELGRFVPPSRFLDAAAPVAEAGEAKAEQFLELIDNQNERSAAKAAGFDKRAVETEARLAQRPFDAVAPSRRLVRLVLGGEFRQGARKARDRGAARPHVEKRPARSACVGGLIGEQALKCRKHQRRLAAARPTDHGDEATVLNKPIEREGLALATEEEAAVSEAEWPQAGKRPLVGKSRPVIRRDRSAGRGFTQCRLGSRSLADFDGAHGLALGAEARSASNCAVGGPFSTRSITLSNSPSWKMSERVVFFLCDAGGGPAISPRKANCPLRPSACQSDSLSASDRTQTSEALPQQSVTASHLARRSLL